MTESTINGIFTLAGAIIALALKLIYDYFQAEKERKDTYYFALLEKRIEAYQKAFALTEKLKEVIHEKTDNKNKVISEVRDWFDNNNLYLTPHIRKKFGDVIYDVRAYNGQLEDYKITGQQKGWDDKETKKKLKDLKSTFGNIMTGIQKEIERDIDVYHKHS